MGRHLTDDDEPRNHLRQGRVAHWLWHNDDLSDIRSVSLTPDGAEVVFLYRWLAVHDPVWRSVTVDIPKAVVLDKSILASALQREPAKLAFRASGMAKVAYLLSDKPRKPDSLYSLMRVVENHERLNRGDVEEFIKYWKVYAKDWSWRNS